MVSIDRPVSEPRLPVTSVRMNTIRSPFLPEMRAQSSGLVVFGRSSFSLNSSTHAASRWETRRPRWFWSKKMAIKDFLDQNQRGLRVSHLLAACVDEFKENEDLPNTTNPDDWARISGKKGERI